MFEGRHIDYRSSKVDTSITDLRRSIHRSSVFEGLHIHLRRHIDLRRSTHRDIDLRRATLSHFNLRRATHRSSKVDISIFESRRIDLRRAKAGTSHLRILSTTALLSPWSRRSYHRCQPSRFRRDSTAFLGYSSRCPALH